MTPMYPRKGAIAGHRSSDPDDMVGEYIPVNECRNENDERDGLKQSPNTRLAIIFKFVYQLTANISCRC